jgi:hypothetical protein
MRLLSFTLPAGAMAAGLSGHKGANVFGKHGDLQQDEHGC